MDTVIVEAANSADYLSGNEKKTGCYRFNGLKETCN